MLFEIRSMNIVFRVDSSTKMGVGHLMRCLALADEFKRQNKKTTFICRNLTGNLINLVKQKGHKVVILSIDIYFRSNNLYLDWLGATQEEDAEQTINAISENVDLLIVDNYALDETWHKQLRPCVKKIMVIDDLADKNIDCDVLLNQNLRSKKEDYKNKIPNDCQLLLGCEYALLRPEFAELRNQALEKRKNTKEIKNILVSMGGNDTKNLTYDILQNVGDGFNITVVFGALSPHNKMIQNYAEKKNIKVIIDANNMAELMLDADLAIGAGGSTSWERCCLGLPTLLFITAENQTQVAINLKKLGAVKIVHNLKEDLKEIVNNFELWQNMSNQAQKVCNGLGAKKVAIV